GAGRLDHLVVRAAALVDKAIAEEDGGVVHDLRLLVGEQLLVAAVLRDEAATHDTLPRSSSNRARATSRSSISNSSPPTTWSPRQWTSCTKTDSKAPPSASVPNVCPMASTPWGAMVTSYMVSMIASDDCSNSAAIHLMYSSAPSRRPAPVRRWS